MVEKLKNLLNRIELEKGEIRLFMLWKNLPEDDTWSVIISADWIDKMGQTSAFNYWIREIRKALLTNELSQISRVSFLKSHDRITNAITSTISVLNKSMHVRRIQVGEIYIEEGIIFRSRRPITRKFLRKTDRDPIYNHNINPIYNHTINPIYNHNINPIYNHNINPIYNPDFPGYLLFNQKIQKRAYFIYANESMMLMFNFDNNLQGFGTENTINGFTIFDKNVNWIGTFIPDGEGGFIFYSESNQYIGFVK